MTRYKVYISIGLDEFHLGTDHVHEKRAKVFNFGDSKTDADKKYKELERKLFGPVTNPKP